MKKILIVIDSLTGGGAEKVLLDILKKIDKKKYSIDLFLLYKHGIYIEEIKKYVNNLNGLKPRNEKYDKNIIFRKCNSLFFKIRNWLFLNEYIYKIKKSYDIEIAFLEGQSTQYIANRKSLAKKISWIHIDLQKHRILNKKIERNVYKKINKIICVSKDSKKSVIGLYPEFEKKIKVIYNLIPKKEILDKSKEYIAKNKKITLLTIGRLNLQKGYDILLKAHKKLIKEGLDYNLKILGEGMLKKEFQEYIVKNNLSKNTELVGFKANPYPYIKNSDVYVMSSRYEGFPLVLCEAIILNKPIIATKCTGPLEILDNGKYGELVEVENIDELANAMKKLIVDEKLRKKYEKLSIERSNFFEDEKIIKEIEELLDEK